MQRSYHTYPDAFYTDDDSGVSVDRDYSSSPMTLTGSTASLATSTLGLHTARARATARPLIWISSDGIVERIRPATMRNSENGDYIVCNTKRGTYIAYRTPIVPAWVTELVREVESREN